MDLGARLRRFRDWAELTQEEVAEHLGVGREALSYWENGRREPSLSQLEILARVYGCRLIDLVGEPAEVREAVRPFPSGLSPRNREVMAHFHELLDAYAELSARLRKAPPPVLLGSISRHSCRALDPAMLAGMVLRQLGVEGPLADLSTLLEPWGFCVFRLPLGRDLRQDISGALLSHKEVGYGILVNLDMTPGRQLFTVAHELAHAVLEPGATQIVCCGAVKDENERRADRFAGEFLVQSHALKRVLAQIGEPSPVDKFSTAARLCRYFNVSYMTILRRLREERLLGGTLARLLEKPDLIAEAAPWTSRSPIDDRVPAGFREAVMMAISHGDMSRGAVAELLQVEDDDIPTCETTGDVTPLAKELEEALAMNAASVT
jgi:Zn-dependent peptidase ImmA (M78 family)/transcriptional regulator with XRE-family HTH domain